MLAPGSASSPPGYEIAYSPSNLLIPGRFDVELLSGPPAQVRVRIVQGFGGNLETVTVPLEEELTCPAGG